MKIRLLGAFEVWHENTKVESGDHQQRHMLAVLALHQNKALTAQRLLDIVWPADAKPQVSLVATYIARIRKSLREAGVAGDPIVKTSEGYRLAIDENDIDVNRFRDLVRRASAATPPAERRRLLREAVELRRGEFLDGLDIDRLGGPGVVSPEESFLDAVGDLAELELDAREHRQARDRLRPLVNADPARQRLVALLMRALLANGDRDKAVAVYHRCREALYDEFGMEPDLALRSLHATAQREHVRSMLPAQPTRFTGRREQLELVEEWSRRAVGEDRDHEHALWISGSPGVGKSALAVYAAHRLRSRFPDGQLFVRLNGFGRTLTPTSTAEALRRLLIGLGVPPEQIPQDTEERVITYRDRLTGTRTLVVLDDAAALAQVEPLLPPAGCFAMVTSRLVGGTQARETLHLEPLPAADAEQLFGDVVGGDRVQPWPDAVATVVRLCGYLPIRIMTVAAQFRQHQSWTPEQLIRLLERARTDGAGATDELSAAFSVSYNYLCGDQRRLFRLLGHNPGTDISMSAAAALADLPDVRTLLDQLYSVSLLDEPVSERYRLLDPLKDFAAMVPPNSPTEMADALTRLVDFYLVNTAGAVGVMFPSDRSRQPTVTRTSPVTLTFPDAQAALEWLTTERENLITAVGHAAGHGLMEPAWQLPVLLWRFFYVTGGQQDWVDTLELARQTIDDAPDHRHGLAQVLLRLSGAYWRAGQPGRALDYAHQALPLWTGYDDRTGEADTRHAMAMATWADGRPDDVAEHFEAALDIYLDIGDARGQANALDMLGILDQQRGELDRSQQRHLAAVTLLREIGDTQSLASTLNNLGAVRQELGLLDEAAEDHRIAGNLAARMGNRATEAAALNAIGSVHRRAGRPDRALYYHELARALAAQVTNPNLRAQLYLDRAETYRELAKLVEARTAYLAALDLSRGTRDRGKQALAQRGMARLMHQTGDHLGAAGRWLAAVNIFDELGWADADATRSELAAMNCDCVG